MAKTAPVITNKTWKYTAFYRALPLSVGLLYIVLVYFSSSVLNTHHFTFLKFYLFQLTVVIPQVIIWVIAMRGAIRFKQYVTTIKDSVDGKSLNYIADSLLLLVFYIMLLPVVRTAVLVLHNASYLRFAVDFANYLPVIVMALTTYKLFVGSQKLNTIVSRSMWTWRRILSVLLPFLLLGGFFLWNFYSVAPTLLTDNGIPRFALPARTLLFTYALPQLVIWLFVIVSCINIAHFSLRTQGSIYRAHFKDLYQGLLLVFGCIFVAQMLIVSSANLAGFGAGVMTVYLVFILATIGFMMVKRGSDQLSLLEKNI